MDAVAVNGAAIREIRRALRIEIADLADEIGCSRAYVTKIELGRSRNVSLKTLDKLEAALCVSDRRALLAHPYQVEPVVLAAPKRRGAA